MADLVEIAYGGRLRTRDAEVYNGRPTEIAYDCKLRPIDGKVYSLRWQIKTPKNMHKVADYLRCLRQTNTIEEADDGRLLANYTGNTFNGDKVFQKRFDGMLEFYRNFSEYENGFGAKDGEFWLGLKYIQELAAHGATEVRLDMSKADDTEAYETFQDFSLTGTSYTLNIGSRTGST
ncbi:ficolin-1-like, partial [Mercenaria mercenaria]|uniref:ficolin-1-like n=1 Tax=Mercenaria mercenaria TaxID=6596 RepID=UPI00234F1032